MSEATHPTHHRPLRRTHDDAAGVTATINRAASAAGAAGRSRGGCRTAPQAVVDRLRHLPQALPLVRQAVAPS
ncbi:hypothetical protein HEP87_57945 [Streptomyces sp. S1D4-11]